MRQRLMAPVPLLIFLGSGNAYESQPGKAPKLADETSRGRRGSGTYPKLADWATLTQYARRTLASRLVLPSARGCGLLFVRLAQIAERPDAERFQHGIIMFFHQHLGGLFRRPRAGQ